MNSEESAEALALAEELVADIELDRTSVDKQVLKASRLARLVGDEEAITWLHRERHGYPASDDPDPQWLRSGRGGDDKVFAGSPALASFVRTLESELSNMQLPETSGEFAVIAIRETRNHISSVRNKVLRFNGVLSAVSNLLHDFAAAQYYGLRFSTQQASLFESAKVKIDSLLTDLDPDAMRKIDSAYRSIRAGDAESIAAAMNSTRRLVDSFADKVFPATSEARPDGQGNSIKLGSEQRLNRIKAFIDDNSASASSSKRPKRAISDIYDRVSTGVHNDVTSTEAQFLFLSTYVLLGEILEMRETGATTATIDLQQ